MTPYGRAGTKSVAEQVGHVRSTWVLSCWIITGLDMLDHQSRHHLALTETGQRV